MSSIRTRWFLPFLTGCVALAIGGSAATRDAGAGGPDQGKEGGGPTQQAVVAEAARLAKRDPLRERGVKNMKTIALALHDYHADHGSFPPSLLRTADEKPPYSWRVAILPYMGEEGKKLYQQYNFAEPWDGPSNRPLLAKIPSAFSLTDATLREGVTSYFALKGPGAVFSGDKGTAMKEIKDGLSTTILFVEWKRPVPWTKPEDIPFVANEPMRKVGGYFETCAQMGGFQAAMVDGSIRLISGTMDDKTVKSFITKAGGEPLGLPD